MGIPLNRRRRWTALLDRYRPVLEHEPETDGRFAVIYRRVGANAPSYAIKPADDMTEAMMDAQRFLWRGLVAIELHDMTLAAPMVYRLRPNFTADAIRADEVHAVREQAEAA